VRLIRVSAILLVIIAAFLRLYRLDHYPLPMHQDELSNAYDAYSIVETGADRNGVHFPIVLRAQGAVDYRPAMYAWCQSVSQASLQQQRESRRQFWALYLSCCFFSLHESS
jgi:4-amino-4-deoxy-L-arabinose transferase-like glycosyltransferase